eukprot:Phypoly_transcript_04976.p1 GENE.Phypoly_transcript_04976~~Phypoly_transcript_04976.p1  ORF type:complete len:455 (-),score=74.40 Phypoly_transcript_04976:75-1439(-)
MKKRKERREDKHTRGDLQDRTRTQKERKVMNYITPFLIITLSILAYLYVNQSINSTDGRLTQEERLLWDNFTSWLEANGVPKIKLKLAYFEGSGRGVAVTDNIKEGEAVVVIPFKVMMNSGRMTATELGQTILQINSDMSEDVFLSICLWYEKIRGNSFWKPYIDLLPTDFSNLPLFFTEEERRTLDGPMVDVMSNQLKLLEEAYTTAATVEKQRPEFGGIANKEGLKWAISAVRSRMWTISELPGRTLVPLADMLNHHPEKGVALDIQPEEATGTIKSNHFYPAGSEFFDKYYLTKIDSDNLYLMTFGFLMNQNDDNTFQIEFNYALSTLPNIREILESHGCGTQREVLSDSDAQIPPHFFECLCILSLEILQDHAKITQENYREFINHNVRLRAKEWANTFFKEELSKFKKDDEQDLLLRPGLTNNMRNILTVRKSEKKVLRHGKDLLKKIT